MLDSYVNLFEILKTSNIDTIIFQSCNFFVFQLCGQKGCPVNKGMTGGMRAGYNSGGRNIGMRR